MQVELVAATDANKLPCVQKRKGTNDPRTKFGISQVELVPGGREVAVTDANKLAYIHCVADFRLNTQLVRVDVLSCCWCIQSSQHVQTSFVFALKAVWAAPA